MTLDHTSRSRLPERIRKIWAYFVVGLALVAALAWTALLGWMAYRAALMLLA